MMTKVIVVALILSGLMIGQAIAKQSTEGALLIKAGYHCYIYKGKQICCWTGPVYTQCS